EIIEPIIAFSIFLLALENIFFNKVKVWRLLIIFLFGLIHGLGFAAALNEIGLPRNRFFTSIVSFNLGVEIGQFVIILMVYFLLIRPFGKKKEYRKWVIYPISILIAMVALYWTIERVVG
ncbi:MAG: HupE/UreJ family protein, partial [Flavisolibacter sp.]|nr:HupE/UreJ family protein [Flavisolibacter sp.]